MGEGGKEWVGEGGRKGVPRVVGAALSASVKMAAEAKPQLMWWAIVVGPRVLPFVVMAVLMTVLGLLGIRL